MVFSIGRTFMPKFLRIGVHQSNVSGYTSKAWCVRRVGSTIFLKWGAVEVHGVGDGRKVYWTLPPRDKTIRCGTEQRAKDYAKAAIARRRNHRYEPLSGNIAKRRRTAVRDAELKQALATILYVDIVRSTEKAARLGDSRWTQVMNHYYAAVRRELKALRGKEVVTTGDGLLATFGAPAAGVRCATAICEAVRTLGLEIMEQVPDAVAVMVPLSGGGLAAGVAAAVKGVSAGTKVVGISMARGAAMKASLDAGRPVQVEELPTLADSLGGGIGLDNRLTFAMCRDLLDDVVLLAEDEIAAGIRHAYGQEREIVEGAGAVGIGALLAGKVKTNGPTVLILSGRNIDMALHRRIVCGEAARATERAA